MREPLFQGWPQERRQSTLSGAGIPIPGSVWGYASH
jgi:hypothetical protein